MKYIHLLGIFYILIKLFASAVIAIQLTNQRLSIAYNWKNYLLLTITYEKLLMLITRNYLLFCNLLCKPITIVFISLYCVDSLKYLLCRSLLVY